MQTNRIPSLSLLIAIIMILASSLALAGPVTQTDWSGGDGAVGPVLRWNDRFASDNTISWRSLPGQLALPGVPRAPFQRVLVARDAGQPEAAAVGDLDGDGRNDLLSGDPVTDSFNPVGAIYWWRAESDGTFTQHYVSDTYYGVNYLTTADVDGDGDLDVVAAAYFGVIDPPPPPPDTRNGRYTWFENINGDASNWVEHTVGELFWGAEYVDVGDFDGDGDMDLVGASYLTRGGYEQDSDITWFENVDGAGQQWTQHDVSSQLDNGYEAHFVDLDGDGDLDILGTHADFISWWENTTGQGDVLQYHPIDNSLQNVGYVAAGDIDNDGDIDIVGSTYSSNSLFWWQNGGGAASWIRHTIEDYPNGEEIKLVDVDGDGDFDVLGDRAYAGGLDGILTLFTNESGDGSAWSSRPISYERNTDYWIAAGDADTDGKIDLVVASEDFDRSLGNQLSYFNLTTFLSGGSLTSSILDGGTQPGWGAMTWDANVSDGASLTVEVRASADANDMGAFIEVPGSGTDLSSLIDPASRYIQYRFRLGGVPDASPVVREVQIEHAGGDNGLTLAGPAQGVAGASNDFLVRSEQIGARIYFAGALMRGHTPIPPCPGLFADLASPRVAGSAIVNANGQAHFSVSVPRAAHGRTLYFQALNSDNCVLSNLVEVPFN